MARRGAALWAALLLAALLVPAASGQAPQLPDVASRHQVLTLDVPVAPDGRGSIQVPVSGGLLDIDLVPTLLDGAGGSVDAEAYVAYVTLLLTDGTSIPLPSMVILAEEVAVDGPMADAFADLAAKAEALRQALLGLQANPVDDALGQVPGLQQQVDALLEQVEWIVALAEAVAGVVTDGAEELLAIFSGTLATLDAAVALVEDGLDRVAEQAEGLPLPSNSASPSPSPSASPPPSPSASATSSPSPVADLAAAEQLLDEAIAEAQGALAALEDEVADVRAILEGVGGTVGDQASEAAGMVGGALNGVAVALAEARAEAQGMQDEAESQAADNAAATQAFVDQVRADAEAAIADLAWATEWVEAAAAFAPAAAQGPLGDAQRAIDVANRTAWRLADTVQDHAPLQVEELAAELDRQTAQAQAAVAEAAAFVDAVAGSMDPDVSVDDAHGLAVCSAAGGSQACLMYIEPAGESPLGVVRLLVAVPMADPLIVDVPGPLGSLTNSLTSAPSPTGVPPVPTPTLPPLPTGLPGSSSSSSSSASSSSASSSASSSSSSSSSGSGAPAPRLAIQADRDTLAMRMGEQSSIAVTVRNEGDAADTVRLTAQTTAPVTLDTPTESMQLAPGASGRFTVRLTPLEAGSGKIDFIASGDAAGSVKDSVEVSVAPAAPSAAKINVAIEPSALAGAVGQSMAITLRLSNDGPVADNVHVAVSGTGFQADPANLDAALAPGEAVLREVRVTPVAMGAHEVLLAITSQRGADLQPMVLLDANSAGADEQRSEDGGSSGPAKGSPALAPIVVGVAVVAAFALARRRLR